MGHKAEARSLLPGSEPFCQGGVLIPRVLAISDSSDTFDEAARGLLYLIGSASKVVTSVWGEPQAVWLVFM